MPDRGIGNRLFDARGQEKRDVFRTTGRWRLRTDIWTSFEDRFGHNDFNIDSNYSNGDPETTPPNPSDIIKGISFDKRKFIYRIKFNGYFDRNNMTVHTAVMKQQRFDNSQNFINTLLYHDVTGWSTANNENVEKILVINKVIEANETLGIFFNKRQGNGNNRSFYCNALVEYSDI